MKEFSLIEYPIDKSTTLIEASAGAAKPTPLPLMVRLIGEGFKHRQILVVTFMAYAELNHRMASVLAKR